MKTNILLNISGLLDTISERGRRSAKLICILAFVLSVLCLLLSPVHAVIRDMGDGTILDTDTGLQFLKDANLAKTSGYYQGLGYTYDTNGGMTYAHAEAWAAQLNVAGHTDWRLPTSIRADGSVCNPMTCADVEFGHLYFLEGITSSTPGMVTNLAGAYWTSTPPFPGSDYRVVFFFVGGNSQAVWTVQDGQPPMKMSAWAVRSAQNDDLDGDGYTFNQNDCNDADANINPGMTEITGNGIDDDCNPATLDMIPPPPPQDQDTDGIVDTVDQCPDTPAGEPVDANGCSAGQIDSDGDGFTPLQGDCNDADAGVNPGAADVCDNTDNDCNGATADGSAEAWYGSATTCGAGVCAASGQLTCTAGMQTDTCTAGAPAEVTEVTCTDNLDNDCDGTVDAADTNCTGVDYYCDGDGDTYISSAVTGSCVGAGCEPAGCQTTAGSDCDDADAGVNPGATEIANNAIDEDCNGSDLSHLISCNDGGNIECLERADGGSDSDNLDVSKPSCSLEYEYMLNIQDSSGAPPVYARMFNVQRSLPLAADFQNVDMFCSGDWTAGATCTLRTKLGPVAVHRFYFEVQMDNGDVYRYPETGDIAGPQIHMLTGYNLVGVPRDLGADSLDGMAAFGCDETFRWNADLGYYTEVTTNDPVKTGEGYFCKGLNSALFELDEYNDIMTATYVHELKSGWNMISNPYTGNVKLSDIMVRKGTGTPVTWVEASANGWIVNAIYVYNGDDWGGTYGFETADEGAALIPWTGSWIYLQMTDDIYYLVIPKP